MTILALAAPTLALLLPIIALCFSALSSASPRLRAEREKELS
jgi:hypothetical protein